MKKKVSKEYSRTMFISTIVYLVILIFFLVYMSSLDFTKDIPLDIVNIIFLVVPVVFTFTMENHYKHHRLKKGLKIIESEEVDIKYLNGIMAVLLCLTYFLIYVVLKIYTKGFGYLSPIAYTIVLIALEYKVINFIMDLNEMIDENL